MNYSKSFNKLLLQVNKRHLQLSRKETTHPFDSYNRNKQGTLSLPSQILFKERTKKISDIYKTISCEKLQLNSTSKSKKKYVLTPQKKKYSSPFNPFSQNMPQKIVNKQKLTLQRTNQSSSFNNTKSNNSDSTYIDAEIKLRILNDKLDQLMKLKSSQNFRNQFKSFLSGNLDKQNQNGTKQPKKRDLLLQCISKLSKCFNINSQAQHQQTNELIMKNKQLQEEITSLNIELKKSSIKLVLFERNLEKEKQLGKKLQKQLISYRNKNKKVSVSIGFNTQSVEEYYDGEDQNDQPSSTVKETDQLSFYQNKCKKLTQQLLKRQKAAASQKKNIKQLGAVLVFLKKQGVDIQTIYDNVINGRTDGCSQKQDQYIRQTIKQLRGQQKKIYKKAKQIKLTNSFDADNSIISSQQGLSFNYEQKSLEIQAYTLRRQYKCKKQLGAEMKAKLNLKLKLNQLYNDDEQDYQQQFENQQDLEEMQTQNNH